MTTNGKSQSLTILSLGAGVQSSVMALMAARGDLAPMPDAAIFADTQWEPQAVYDHLDWLERQLPYPVYRVSKGSIRESILEGTKQGGRRYASIPFFIEDGGIGRRQCTAEFKILPIRRKIRELAGLKHRQHAPKGLLVSQWLGISTDEITRMKQAPEKWIKNRFPLIDDLPMSRADCLAWFKRRYLGRHLPRSSCIGCPFHKDSEWRDMRDNHPESFADAIFIDEQIRSASRGCLRGMKQKQYMHRSRKPLAEVDLSTPAERGQVEFGFMDECDGICGL